MEKIEQRQKLTTEVEQKQKQTTEMEQNVDKVSRWETEEWITMWQR